MQVRWHMSILVSVGKSPDSTILQLIGLFVTKKPINFKFVCISPSSSVSDNVDSYFSGVLTRYFFRNVYSICDEELTIFELIGFLFTGFHFTINKHSHSSFCFSWRPQQLFSGTVWPQYILSSVTKFYLIEQYRLEI